MGSSMSSHQQTDGIATPSSTLMTWIPVAGMALVLISAAFIAVVVVLSLIPIFTPVGDFPVNVAHSKELTVVYRTNLIKGSLLIVDHTDQLSSSLDNALHLYGVDSLTAQLTSSITCGQVNNELTRVNERGIPVNVGDLLVLTFTPRYPRRCFFPRCRQQFDNDVLLIIGTIYANLSVPIAFTNGEVVEVNLNFCSFNDTSQCQTNIGACTTGEERTLTCDQIIDEETCDCDCDEEMCTDDSDSDDEDCSNTVTYCQD